MTETEIDLLDAIKRLRNKYRHCARAHGNDDETIAASIEFVDEVIAKAESRP